ncbi:MAG: DUF5682 family protein [Chloroflexota bacterium]
MNVRYFGVRHHGPGSARGLLAAFREWQPDCVLIEGPPDAADVLHLAAHEGMQPPVALIVHETDNATRAAYYPFATFSPEWQALRYALSRSVPVRFVDMPLKHRFAEVESGHPSLDHEGEAGGSPDPWGALARAAGWDDGEDWWDVLVEQRRGVDSAFEAVAELMATLRAEIEPEPPLLTRQREAFMRLAVRAASKEGHDRIAVVCGAWHVPALIQPGPASADVALTRGLPTVKTTATWVPWTMDRLARASGYGAGADAPGWYAHLWEHPEDVAVKWLARVAALMRDEGMDTSSAHVIEAVRLATALSAVRDRHEPGLAELNEAALTVICHGDPLKLAVIHRALTVGASLGEVPDTVPMVPLQCDLTALQRRLRLRPEVHERVLDLDLRKETDLERSHLLHRLALCGIPWGTLRDRSQRTSTFHEVWALSWRPELASLVIDAARWGNSVLEAAEARVVATATDANTLPELTALIGHTLLASLPAAVAPVLKRLADLAGTTSDLSAVMDAIPPLARAARYGDVRQTDAEQLKPILASLVLRTCVGFRTATSQLDDDAAIAMRERISRVDWAVWSQDDGALRDTWQGTLLMGADSTPHGQVSGRCARLLLERGIVASDWAGDRMSLALSRGSDTSFGSAWLEGFLSGNGFMLIHHTELWDVVDRWLCSLTPERFQDTLPLVRRTFASFHAGERRQLWARVLGIDRSGRVWWNDPIDNSNPHLGQAMDTLGQLLGVPVSALEAVA